MTIDSLIEAEVKLAIRQLRTCELRLRELALVASAGLRDHRIEAMKIIQRCADAAANETAKYLEQFRKEDGA